MSSRCRSCNAEILWAETANGKKMPLDAEPVDASELLAGLQVLLKGRGDHGEDLVTSAVATGLPVPLYRSHFATCPDAAQHRRSA